MVNQTLNVLDGNLYRVDFKAMGSACEVVIAANDKEEALRCISLAIHEVERIEKKYSRYLSSSLVSKINEGAGSSWVECDDETESLLNYANTLYQMSEGLFDITSGVLRKIWDFKKAVIPKEKEIEAILKFIGWSNVERKNASIKLPIKGMEIDFGGFGKEYAVDRAATLLSEQGIEHGFINLGGDLRIIGPKPDGSPWIMGIKDPNNNQSLIASIPVSQGALATSGNYEKFFDVDGKRYCHIISPLTGYPVDFWKSVSLLAPLSINAGTYTTIAMLKESKGLDWIKESKFSYLAIDNQDHFYQEDLT